MDEASQIFDGTQVISQLRENQNIEYKGMKRNLKGYFNSTTRALKLLASACGKAVKQRWVVRVKSDCATAKNALSLLEIWRRKRLRYLVATDRRKRTLDIIQAYTWDGCRGLLWGLEALWRMGAWGQQLDEEGIKPWAWSWCLLFDHASSFTRSRQPA